MTARLGFAIATSVKPDILIVDEILSVGDAAFQKKCERKMSELMSGGTTMLLVSHSSEKVKKLCSKALWLDHGQIAALGNAGDISDRYLENRQ
jgi:ABC-type polysaccharide/polyol phosphate transport system ATPase subunit